MTTNEWTTWASWTQWWSDWRDVILDRTLDQLLGALAVGFVLSVVVSWVVVRLCRARREAVAPVAAVLLLGHLIAMSVGGVQIHRDLHDLTQLHHSALEHLAQRDAQWRATRAGDRARPDHPAERQRAARPSAGATLDQTPAPQTSP